MSEPRRGLVERVRAVLAGFSRRANPRVPSALSGADSRGWWGLWDSADSVGFQSDQRLPEDQELAFFAVFACITQIAGDIGKLGLNFTERSQDGIWTPTTPPTAYSPLMRRPNAFQTWQQFMETWMVSKLKRGNFVAVKDRDARQVVTALYPTEWRNTTPLIAPDGSVWYSFQKDELARIPDDVPAAPASEVLHDRATPMFHPLIGTSPLFAAGLAASQGTRIQRNSTTFFKNMSRPSGILIAPTQIDEATAARIKTQWETNYRSGDIGRTAVLGDNLKYESLGATPEDSQLVEQLRLSAEQVCSAFQVPGFMVGIGQPRSSDNVQALVLMYYAQCLQKHIEAAEALIDDAMGLDRNRYRVAFDLDDLLRTDSKTLAEVEGLKVQRGISKPNEARRKFNLPAVSGGDTPYLQQQNFGLEALAKRDASENPFGSAPAPAPNPPPEDDAEGDAELADAAAEKAVGLVALRFSESIAALSPVLQRLESAVANQGAELERIQREAADRVAAQRSEQELIDAFEQRFAAAG